MIPRNWEKSLKNRGWEVDDLGNILKEIDGNNHADINIGFCELGDIGYKSNWWVVTIYLKMGGKFLEFQPIYKRMYSALGSAMRAARIFDNFIEKGRGIPKEVLEDWERRQ